MGSLSMGKGERGFGGVRVPLPALPPETGLVIMSSARIRGPWWIWHQWLQVSKIMDLSERIVTGALSHYS